jgi:hypothetical protein
MEIIFWPKYFLYFERMLNKSDFYSEFNEFDDTKYSLEHTSWDIHIWLKKWTNILTNKIYTIFGSSELLNQIIHILLENKEQIKYKESFFSKKVVSIIHWLMYYWESPVCWGQNYVYVGQEGPGTKKKYIKYNDQNHTYNLLLYIQYWILTICIFLVKLR